MSKMLKLILALGSLVLVANGQSQPIKTAPYNPPAKAKAPAKATSAAAPPASGAIQGIPAGAVKIDENTYRFQEKDGKVWLFRRSPFGVSKVEEQQAANIGKPLPAPETPATVSDLGDSYRFERSGPFGSKVWTKKKSELTPEERAIVDRGEHISSNQKAVN